LVSSKLLLLWKGKRAVVPAVPSRSWHEITAEASQTADQRRLEQLAHELLRLYEAERKQPSAEETLQEEDGG